MAEPDSDLTEAELMRQCGPLYVSMGLESLSTTCMAFAFMYLLLLITNKGRLASPGKAAWTFIVAQFKAFYNDVSSEVGNWPHMASAPLPKRFALCRKTNQAVCVFSLTACMLTIERWLHINNVNGIKWLGYAMTCPPMQTELVILIAPVVPCYRLMCVFTYSVTFSMLIIGYATSLRDGDVWTGDLIVFAETRDMAELGLDPKGTTLLPAISILLFLSCIQIPYLALLYKINGGEKNGLPHNYLKLLGIVLVTWLAFPCWWIFSYEGKSLVSDTKTNALAFALLNMLSKGSFTFTLVGITKWHARETKRKEFLARGLTLEEAIQKTEEAQKEERTQQLHQARRADRRTETWVVKILRPYDQDEAPAVPWNELEPTFRAFLAGNKINPVIWNNMSAEKRTTLRDQYDSTMDMVIAVDNESMVQADRNFQNSQPLKETKNSNSAPVEPIPRMESKSASSPRMESSPRSISVAASPRRPQFDDPMTEQLSDEPNIGMGSNYDQEDLDEEEDAELLEIQQRQLDELTKKIRVGQTLTTLQNIKGRVVRTLPNNRVQLSMKGRPSQTVRVEDLTVLKVVFLSARGLQNVEFPEGGAAYATCLLQGRPSSEVRGPVAPEGPRAAWDHDEVDLLGWSPGDNLTFRLWVLDTYSRSEELLGEGFVSAAQLEDGGFEGEIQLTAAGRPIPLHLSVMVVIVNQPDWEEEEEQQDYSQHWRSGTLGGL